MRNCLMDGEDEDREYLRRGCWRSPGWLTVDVSLPIVTAQCYRHVSVTRHGAHTMVALVS